MQQVTQCVGSDRFINAFMAAISDPQRAQFVLSAGNLRGAGVPLPPGATILARPSNTRDNKIIHLGLPPPRVSFRSTYQISMEVPRDTLRMALQNALRGYMNEVTQCVTSHGFCYALDEVQSRHKSQPETNLAQYAQSILGAANLQALGAPVPAACRIDVDALTQLWFISLVAGPVEIMFNYPN